VAMRKRFEKKLHEPAAVGVAKFQVHIEEVW